MSRPMAPSWVQIYLDTGGQRSLHDVSAIPERRERQSEIPNRDLDRSCTPWRYCNWNTGNRSA